jgi:hypothetical protein
MSDEQDRIWIPSGGECWATIARYGSCATGRDYTSLPEDFLRLGKAPGKVGGRWVPLAEWKKIWMLAAIEAREELKAIKAAAEEVLCCDCQTPLSREEKECGRDMCFGCYCHHQG